MAKKKKEKTIDKDISVNELADIIKNGINKKFKSKSIASFGADIEDVTTWLKTGSSLLDLAISNRPNGGYPSGKIVELAGLEGAGKSLLAMYALKHTIESGGIGVLIDTESAHNKQFMEAIGVDLTRLVIIEMNILEDIYQTIEDILLDIKASGKTNTPVTIVMDSQSAAIAKNEEDSDFEKQGWNTDKAIINSMAMRKITLLIGDLNATLIITQQLRVELGKTFGDPYCIDPYTTKIEIRYKQEINSVKGNDFTYETVTFEQLSDRFANNDDFENTEVFDINPDFELEVKGRDLKLNEDVYRPILTFLIKDSVKRYYTDGELKGSANHQVYDDTYELVKLSKHNNFKSVNKLLHIVDIEVEDIHNYYANGYLNHNTTSGGKAIGFHASVRIRLKQAGKIKGKVNGIEQVIGIETKAIVTKNRVGPNNREAHFKIYYDSGIADLDNWLELLKVHGIIKSGGAWYTYYDNEKVMDDGVSPVEYKFQRKNWENMLVKNNESDETLSKFIPGLHAQIYKHVCDLSIMAYKTNKRADEDVYVDRSNSDLTGTELEQAKLNNNEK